MTSWFTSVATAASAESTGGPAPSSPADRVRQTAKWVIAAFAAVGGALAAGVPLSSIGSVSWWRVLIAGVAVLAAFGGIALAVINVGHVLDPNEATLEKVKTSEALKQRLGEDASFYGGFQHDRDHLIARYLNVSEELRSDQAHRWEALRRDAADPSVTAAVAKEHKDRHDTIVAGLNEERNALGRVVQLWRSIVIYEETKDDYRRARRPILIGAALALLGLVGYAWAANPPKHETGERGHYCAQHHARCRGERGAEGPRGRPGANGRPGRKGERGPSGPSPVPPNPSPVPEPGS